MKQHHENNFKHQHQAENHAEQRPADGQTATNESIYDSLATDAWFPALYADDLVDDDIKIYEP